ncbi:MAG: hypothetical protein CM15mV22_0900 [Eurybiavirus sp.]|nr:MAG: hypothetical protein CM15mV22_0900 [Eurybiavirus sp.]
MSSFPGFPLGKTIFLTISKKSPDSAAKPRPDGRSIFWDPFGQVQPNDQQDRQKTLLNGFTASTNTLYLSKSIVMKLIALSLGTIRNPKPDLARNLMFSVVSPKPKGSPAKLRLVLSIIP